MSLATLNRCALNTVVVWKTSLGRPTAWRWISACGWDRLWGFRNARLLRGVPRDRSIRRSDARSQTRLDSRPIGATKSRGTPAKQRPLLIASQGLDIPCNFRDGSHQEGACLGRRNRTRRFEGAIIDNAGASKRNAKASAEMRHLNARQMRMRRRLARADASGIRRRGSGSGSSKEPLPSLPKSIRTQIKPATHVKRRNPSERGIISQIW
jgi:hypothetical protein